MEEAGVKKGGELMGDRAPGGYLGLIQRFPLRPIASDRALKNASEIVDELLDRKLTKEEDGYLEVLSLLIEVYESTSDAMEPVSDREVLGHLIEARGVSQREVAQESSIAVSTLSELVSGKRPINRQHIEKLAAYFGVDPGVFLGSGSHLNSRKQEVVTAQ